VVAFAILAAVASTSAGCSTARSSSGAGSTGPNGRHFFEGVVSYQGRQGPPPGKLTATLTVKGDDFRMDLMMADGQRGAAGFHGASQTLCFQIEPMARWIPLDLNTLALFYARLERSSEDDDRSHVDRCASCRTFGARANLRSLTGPRSVARVALATARL